MNEEEERKVSDLRALCRANIVHQTIITNKPIGDSPNLLKIETNLMLDHLSKYLTYGLPQNNEIKEVIKRLNDLNI